MAGPTHALGRRAHFDDRSRNYRIRSVLDRLGVSARVPRSYTWRCEPRLDQDGVGACVGFAWAHEVAARPVLRPADAALAFRIYRSAQLIDQWPETPPAEGTSVLAGVKIAQGLGYYAEYRWAGAGSGRVLEDVVLTLGYLGPMVAGSEWTEDMFDPDASGLLHPTGAIAGGHAYLLNGVRCRWASTVPILDRAFANLDRRTSLVRVHNSWGADWGVDGEAFLTLDEMEGLLERGGEACIPVRRTTP